MKLNLAVKLNREVEKGDVLVLKRPDDSIVYYLIVENKVHQNFTLVNMETLNLMANIVAISPSELVEETSNRLRRLEFIEIIPKEELEINRVPANHGGL